MQEHISQLNAKIIQKYGFEKNNLVKANIKVINLKIGFTDCNEIFVIKKKW
jgi:hypothetical protein